MFAAFTQVKVLAALTVATAGVGLTAQSAKADSCRGGFGVSVVVASPRGGCVPTYVTRTPYVCAYPATTTCYQPAVTYVQPVPTTCYQPVPTTCYQPPVAQACPVADPTPVYTPTYTPVTVVQPTYVSVPVYRPVPLYTAGCTGRVGVVFGGHCGTPVVAVRGGCRW